MDELAFGIGFSAGRAVFPPFPYSYFICGKTDPV